jgi:hypothetical protein
MQTHSFKLLCAALLASSLAPAAHAVQLSTDGTGQVLLFPYYTVRNGFVTQLSVVNTLESTKILKVRFRESLNGRAVLDFNFFLAPNDTWTAAVVDGPAGARLVTNDNSCVTPSDLFTEARVDPFGNVLNAFKNFDYSGQFADSPSLATLDRTREGFFEVFEMGVVDAGASTQANFIITAASGDAATRNCAGLDAFDPGAVRAVQFPNRGASLLVPPTGGLTGRASLINAASGANYSYSPTVLDMFTSDILYSAAGDSQSPTLASAKPFVSLVNTQRGTVIANWRNGREATSAVLMREALSNEFVIDEGTASQTDWVVTFPNKYLYTDRRYSTAFAPAQLFVVDSSTDPVHACEGYAYTAFNRDGTSMRPSEICPLPPPAPIGTRALCLAATTIPLAAPTTITSGTNSAAGLLGSAQPASTGGGGCPVSALFVTGNAITTPGSGTTPSLRLPSIGPHGTANLKFQGFGNRQLTPISALLVNLGGSITTIPGIHYGLPMIGLMLHNYKNTNVASRYGGVLEHRYTIRIE